MPDGSILFTALLAFSSAIENPALPDVAQLQAALNALETCRGLTGPDCPPPFRIYRVHRARCVGIAPEQQSVTVACRVDLSLDYPQPEQNTRHRDECLRFVRRGDAGRAEGWAVANIRDRPCEMQSMLNRDPHPEPDRGELERALVAMHSCYDFDGITDCFVQPTGARVRSVNCEGLSPGEEGRARAMCRLSARIAYSSGVRPQYLTDICVEIERSTPADESPALWGSMEILDPVRCELR